MYNAQEMATAVQHKINGSQVVFNDNAYGNVARDLDEAWGGHYGVDAPQPRLHEAGRRLRRPRHPRQGARSRSAAWSRDAIQIDRPVLIEVPVSRMPRPAFWPPRKEPTKYQR